MTHKPSDGENKNQQTVIEDLTLKETGSENVKGGAVDMFLKITDVKGESKGDERPRR